MNANEELKCKIAAEVNDLIEESISCLAEKIETVLKRADLWYGIGNKGCLDCNDGCLDRNGDLWAADGLLPEEDAVRWLHSTNESNEEKN